MLKTFCLGQKSFLKWPKKDSRQNNILKCFENFLSSRIWDFAKFENSVLLNFSSVDKFLLGLKKGSFYYDLNKYFFPTALVYLYHSYFATFHAFPALHDHKLCFIIAFAPSIVLPPRMRSWSWRLQRRLTDRLLPSS